MRCRPISVFRPFFALTLVVLGVVTSIAHGQEPPPAPGDSSESCASLTDRAMAADLRAAAQQAQKADPSQIGLNLNDSIRIWTLATETCTDRARDRARKSLANAQRALGAVEAELGAGPECAPRQKDATQLQELAQQAVKERRWMDASVLFDKAETMWDVAAERCTGEARKQAEMRRTQAATDGHNAEYCAPLFEKAREATQSMNRMSDPQDKAKKAMHSQHAETIWRQAIQHCKGQPQDLARQNAQKLARDRGTPWVSTGPEPTSSATIGSPANATDSQMSHQPKADTTAPSPNKGVAALPTPPNPVSVLPPEPKLMDVTVGDVRFIGHFTRKDEKLTGNGTVSWANGDRYEGDLLNHLRHGSGEFTWANGQKYKGQWVDNQPMGQGKLTFANGNQYEGQVEAGKPHGNGTMVFASGDTFTGPFVHGDAIGRGRYRWANGQVFEGPWSNGNPSGHGVLQFANGNRYEGMLQEGVPHGNGKLVFASGDWYEGQFNKGISSGEGSYVWKSGDRYKGRWQNGVKHGQGRFEWANGDAWVGEFANDIQTDRGELIRKQP